MHNPGRRNNNNRRFKSNNQNKRRYGGPGSGGGSAGLDDESNININQRKNFANKRDQYLLKAKDCLASGDRVEAESYFQHADHCFRMMNSGLTNGARFDPQRGMIQNANYTSPPEGTEQSGQPDQSGNTQNNGANGNSDISSLPFLQSPIEVNDQGPKIIE